MCLGERTARTREWGEIPLSLQVAVDVFVRSVLSLYNFAYAIAIVLFLTKFSKLEHPVRTLALRFFVMLLVVWCLGTLSDLIFPNSITWTILPVVVAALYLRDWPVPIRLARSTLLMCAWVYSLAVADAINASFHGGILLASLMSLAYVAIIWLLIEFFERKNDAANADIKLLTVVPVIIVCASGLANRAILILRSDFGVEPYSVKTLESLLTCMNGQIAELVVYVCVLMLAKEFSSTQRADAERHLMEVKLEGLRVFQQSSESFHELRHEVKNQYAYIKMLLDQKDFDRAEEFFGEMSMRANPTFSYVATGNELVDDIVNLEIVRARARGVQISPRIAVPEHLPFSGPDLCSLLTNLLDNAIEAAAGGEDPTVNLAMVVDHGTLLISVANPAKSAPVIKENGSLATSKSDVSHHGYGTRIIKRIAQANGGVVNFSYEDGIFTAKVMLVMKG